MINPRRLVLRRRQVHVVTFLSYAGQERCGIGSNISHLSFCLSRQSVSLLGKAIAYIKAQEEHHRKMSFQEEFLALLRKHRIAYDERYLWE